MPAASAAEVPQGLKPFTNELYCRPKGLLHPLTDHCRAGRFKLTHYRLGLRLDHPKKSARVRGVSELLSGSPASPTVNKFPGYFRKDTQAEIVAVSWQ